MEQPHTILITGASSGIGAALAKEYAAPGVTLGLTGRHAVRLEETATLCRELGAVVHTGLIDVRNRDALAQFIMRFDELHAVDLIIANAGISAGSFQGIEGEDKALAIFETNVTGVLNTIHPLMPRMMARRSGQIAIMSSLASFRALPQAPAYSASKAAVRYYGEALRGLLKPYGIHVNIICPGWIDTRMTSVNQFYMPLLMTAPRAANRIARGLKRNEACIAFPRRLYYPLRIFGALPAAWTDPLIGMIRAEADKS